MGNRTTISNLSTSASTLLDQWFVVDDGTQTRKLRGSQLAQLVGSGHTHSQYITADGTETLTNKTLTDYTNWIHADAVHQRVKATENLSKGQPVSYVDYNSGENAVEVVAANHLTTVSIGLLDEDLSTGEFGEVISNGIIEGFDTSSYSGGTILYVDNGNLTPVDPSSGFSQAIAFVLRSHAINGALMVNAAYPKQDTSDIRGISPYAQTLLDDTTAAEMRTTLGVYDDLTSHTVTGATSAITLTFTGATEVFNISITQNSSITFTGDTNNSAVEIWVTTDTIGRTLTFPSGTKIQYPSTTEQIEFIDGGLFLITGKKIGSTWYLSYTIDPYE